MSDRMKSTIWIVFSGIALIVGIIADLPQFLASILSLVYAAEMSHAVFVVVVTVICVLGLVVIWKSDDGSGLEDKYPSVRTRRLISEIVIEASRNVTRANRLDDMLKCAANEYDIHIPARLRAMVGDEEAEAYMRVIEEAKLAAKGREDEEIIIFDVGETHLSGRQEQLHLEVMKEIESAEEL